MSTKQSGIRKIDKNFRDKNIILHQCSSHLKKQAHKKTMQLFTTYSDAIICHPKTKTVKAAVHAAFFVPIKVRSDMPTHIA